MKKWLCNSCCSNNCPKGAYPQEEHCENYEEVTRYLYGMRLRGFSIGCQPMNGFEGLVEEMPRTVEKEYHDVLIYNRKLTEEEVENYELDYLGEGDVKEI